METNAKIEANLAEKPIPVNDKVYIIGDSHVRAFAYNTAFISLLIGPAAFNNFLTEKKKKTTLSKVLALTKLLPKGAKLMLTFSGDVEHTVRKTFANTKPSKEHDNEILLAALNHYKSGILEIKSALDGQLIICAVHPGNTDIYVEYAESYNAQLEEFCNKNGLEFINVWEETTINKKLNPRYLADAAHITYHVADILAEELYKRKIVTQKPQEFSWAYKYEINTSAGPLKIWGEFDKNDLILEEGQMIIWSRQQQTTQLHTDCVAEINHLLPQLFPQKNNLCSLVLDAKEGFVPFLLNEQFEKITGIDTAQDKVIAAHQLQPLYNKDNIEFKWSEKITADSNFEQKYDIAISLNRPSYNDKFKLDFYKKIQSAADNFFLLSYNLKKDRRLLKKAGYKFIYLIPYAISGRKDILDYSLLLAMKEKQNVLKHHNWNVYKYLLRMFSNELKSIYKFIKASLE